METRNIVLVGVVAVAAFLFWRSRQATAAQLSTSVPGYATPVAPAAPAPSPSGGGSYSQAVKSVAGGVTSGSFVQGAVGDVAGGAKSLVVYGANKAISTTLGSIKSSVSTTVNVAHTAVSGVKSVASSVISGISHIL